MWFLRNGSIYPKLSSWWVQSFLKYSLVILSLAVESLVIASILFLTVAIFVLCPFIFVSVVGDLLILLIYFKEEAFHIIWFFCVFEQFCILFLLLTASFGLFCVWFAFVFIVFCDNKLNYSFNPFLCFYAFHIFCYAFPFLSNSILFYSFIHIFKLYNMFWYAHT